MTPSPLSGAVSVTTGTVALAAHSRRPGSVLHVPASYSPGRPAPLLVLLHGAHGTGQALLPLFINMAEESGTIVLAPSSRGTTWDAIQSAFGPDTADVDGLLARLFATYAIDHSRMAIGGFSDGGSYALSLGLTNGELFGHVMAFSPGFMAPSRLVGWPRIFMAHGTEDEVLPIDRCGRRLASILRRQGHHLTYREFQGRHVVRSHMVEQAFTWFLGEARARHFSARPSLRA